MANGLVTEGDDGVDGTREVSIFKEKASGL